MVENKKRKFWYISIVVIISFTLILYMIEFLTVKPVFNITSFSLNYVISLPFLLLSLIINSCVGIIANRTISRKQPVFVRIIVNGVLAVLVAGIQDGCILEIGGGDDIAQYNLISCGRLHDTGGCQPESAEGKCHSAIQAAKESD